MEVWLWYSSISGTQIWLSSMATGEATKVSDCTPAHSAGFHASRESDHDMRTHSCSAIVARGQAEDVHVNAEAHVHRPAVGAARRDGLVVAEAGAVAAL